MDSSFCGSVDLPDHLAASISNLKYYFRCIGAAGLIVTQVIREDGPEIRIARSEVIALRPVVADLFVHPRFAAGRKESRFGTQHRGIQLAKTGEVIQDEEAPAK
jgi:hypothetical protein